MEMLEYENEGITAEKLTFTDNQALLVGRRPHVSTDAHLSIVDARSFLWLNHWASFRCSTTRVAYRRYENGDDRCK